MSLPDLEHATFVLHEAGTKPDRVTFVPCDPFCMFDAGLGPCCEPNAVTVMLVDDTRGTAISYCMRHMKLIYEAVVAWRMRNNKKPLNPLDEILAGKKATRE